VHLFIQFYSEILHLKFGQVQIYFIPFFVHKYVQFCISFWMGGGDGWASLNKIRNKKMKETKVDENKYKVVKKTHVDKIDKYLEKID
jgi:hypothetical protein